MRNLKAVRAINYLGKIVPCFISILIAAAFLIGMLPVVSSAGYVNLSIEEDKLDGLDSQSAVQQPETAEQHLLEIWSDLLSVLNETYEAELWAIDYVETFCQSNDWKDLAEARAACLLAASRISELPTESDTLSEEEYVQLAERGIDIEYLPEEIASVYGTESSDSSDEKSDIQQAYFTLRMCFLPMLEDLDYPYTIEEVMNKCSIEREYAEALIQYYMCTTNYMLLSLQLPELTSGFWDSIKDECPVLWQYTDGWKDNREELMQAASSVLDILQYKNVDDYSMSLAEKENTTEQIEKMLEEGDFDRLCSLLPKFSNEPDRVINPDFLDYYTAKYLFYSYDGSGNVVYPSYGDQLDQYNICEVIEYEGVDAETVGAYIQLLDQLGYYTKEEGKGEWSVIMDEYGISFSMQSDDIVRILFYKEVCTFAPYWCFLQ